MCAKNNLRVFIPLNSFMKDKNELECFATRKADMRKLEDTRNQSVDCWKKQSRPLKHAEKYVISF